MLFHKHLLVNAKVTNPMNTEEQGIEFLKFLVDQIDMKIIKGPFASYVDAEKRAHQEWFNKGFEFYHEQHLLTRLES